MERDWTVDTNVLYKAACVDYDAIAFLQQVLKNRNWIVFDFEGKIESEYRKCIGKVINQRGYDALKKWFIKSICRAKRVSNKINNKHLKALKNLNFHQKDIPFVGVCYKSNDKKLVSEDSDYTNKIITYLNTKMSINVLSIELALALIQKK